LDRLRITEIFYSLQGESKTIGLPTTFVRLTGCPLRCTYCDTAYAFKGGQWMTFSEIFSQVKSFGSHFITVTGGEPLAQKACLPFLSSLCDQNYSVSLETSGALDVSQVDERVIKVMDLKTPASHECERNLMTNLRYIQAKDQIKIVICNRDDYEWTKQVIQDYHLDGLCEILLSPSHDELPPKELANWILADHLPVRFQLQIHKYIWGDLPGH